MLLNKKEGNITRANAINLNHSNILGSHTGRQASASLPPRQGSNPSQTSRQAGTLFSSGEVSNSSPAGSQAGTLLPSREGSSSPKAIAHLPPGEGAIHPQQVVRQALSFPLGKEAVLPRQLLTFLPVKEAIHP